MEKTMKGTIGLLLAALFALPLVASAGQGSTAPSPAAPRPPAGGVLAANSRYGMNMYFTNASRSDAEVNQLSPLAQAIGVRWSREQISWASYDLDWGPGFFDARISKLVNDGFLVYGMLSTTPDRFSTQACKDWADAHGYPRYFCPPANMADWAAWVGEVVERYDGDGYLDAPGSPRIPYWEIWNEPDVMNTWLPAPDPAAYTDMLCRSYQTIKAADPTAKVIVGGLSDFDTVGRDGFMDAVVAHGGWPCFDILGYHFYDFPYMPEWPGQVWNMPSVADMVVNWIEAHGGGREVWANEFGWSTCTNCGGNGNTEDEQANYIVRAHPLLMDHGIDHLDLFYLKDIQGGMGTPYMEMAILRPDYSAKPAYTAYGVMMERIGNASFAGHGQLYAVSDSLSDRHDYIYVGPGGVLTDIIWQLQGQTACAFWVESGVTQVHLYSRDGAHQVLTPSGGYVTVNVSPSPIYVVRVLNLDEHAFLPLVMRR